MTLAWFGASRRATTNSLGTTSQPCASLPPWHSGFNQLSLDPSYGNGTTSIRSAAIQCALIRRRPIGQHRDFDEKRIVPRRQEFDAVYSGRQIQVVVVAT